MGGDFRAKRSGFSEAVAVSLILGLAGCVSKGQAVYVDLEQVIRKESLPTFSSIPTPTPSPGFGSSTVTFPARPPSSFSLGKDQERIADVQRTLQENRAALTQDIRAHLAATYTAHIQHQIEAERATIPEQMRPRYDENQSKIDLMFQDYAHRRGPLIARLALLAGYPDPDPQSQRKPPPNVPAIYRRYTEAASLRKQISQMDQEYTSQVAGMYAGLAAQEQSSYAKIDAERKRLLLEAEQQAMTKAAQEVHQKQAPLQSALKNKAVVSFPAEPGVAVTVQGAAKPPAAPTVQVPGQSEMTQRLREAEASDLKVWAALNRYVISSDRRGARDATAEFIRWRRTHLALR
jgi:hypothetical protein